MACLVCFLIEPRTTPAEMVPPTTGSPSAQIANEERPGSLAYSLITEGIFSTEASFLSDDISLCQVGKTSQHTVQSLL